MREYICILVNLLILIPLLRVSTTHKANYTIEVSEKLKKIAFPVVKGQRARPIAICDYFSIVFFFLVGIVILFIKGLAYNYLCLLIYLFAICLSFVIGPIVEAIIKFRDPKRINKKRDFGGIVIWSIVLLAFLFLILLKLQSVLAK